MFRVLSDEESRKVKRWQAPALGSDQVAVANTRQQAKPNHSLGDSEVRPLLGSASLKPGRAQSPIAAPNLQTINTVQVLASGAFGKANNTLHAGQADTSSQMEHVSAEMLQASYDEGYSRGFAEGNKALQQQSIDELRRIVTAIDDASERREDPGLEQALVSLSLDIARLVVRREVTIDDSLMLDIIHAGIDQLPACDESLNYINLHPLDANIVRQHVLSDEKLQIVDDPSLARGECRIESGASVVNAGMEDWLHSVSVQLGVETDQSSELESGLMNVNDSDPTTDSVNT